MNVTGDDCAAGYYSLGRQTECTKCPPGYFCENVDEEPVVCEAGFYSNGTLTACVECDPGYACPEASKSPRPADGLCPLGYYCLDGKDLTSCPAGMHVNVKRTNIQNMGFSLTQSLTSFPMSS